MKTIIIMLFLITLTFPVYGKPIDVIGDVELTGEQIKEVEDFVRRELESGEFEAGYILVGKKAYRNLDKAQVENYMFRSPVSGFDSGFPNREFSQGAHYKMTNKKGGQYRVIEFDGISQDTLAHELAHAYCPLSKNSEEVAKEIEFKWISRK